MRFRGLLLSLALGSGGIPASGASAACPDLALVLAIDGSGSIDDQEFQLQQQGYVAAFADGRVQAALGSAGVVDVAVVLWGDAEMEVQVIAWQRITAPGEAARVARRIGALPRKVTGDTGIGSGLWAALDLLESGAVCATRRIINVSGDGKESFGARSRHHIPLALARSRAEAMGVTINGLAITVAGPQLETWYRDKVITGPGAFVLAAESFEAFGDAIIRKLAREISPPTLAAANTGRKAMP